MPGRIRVIDRLYEYINYKGISAYAFERSIDISNGYIGKQARTGGGIGSEILEKIYHEYLDLSLIWLITGEGKMILPPGTTNRRTELNAAEEDQGVYLRRDEAMEWLKKQEAMLEKIHSGQQKMIDMLGKQPAKKR